MRDYKKKLKEDLDYGRKNGFKVVLVEANPEKGFNYSYFVYIPNNPQNTIMMDCLNDNESTKKTKCIPKITRFYKKVNKSLSYVRD